MVDGDVRTQIDLEPAGGFLGIPPVGRHRLIVVAAVGEVGQEAGHLVPGGGSHRSAEADVSLLGIHARHIGQRGILSACGSRDGKRSAVRTLPGLRFLCGSPLHPVRFHLREAEHLPLAAGNARRNPQGRTGYVVKIIVGYGSVGAMLQTMLLHNAGPVFPVPYIDSEIHRPVRKKVGVIEVGQPDMADRLRLVGGYLDAGILIFENNQTWGILMYIGFAIRQVGQRIVLHCKIVGV